MITYKFHKHQQVIVRGADPVRSITAGEKGRVIARRPGPDYLVQFPGRQWPVSCTEAELDTRDHGEGFAFFRWTNRMVGVDFDPSPELNTRLLYWWWVGRFGRDITISFVGCG
jgi:hypothetical protein